MVYLEKQYAEEMIAHARAEAPLECCGVLAGKEGRVEKLYRTTNAEKSAIRYSVKPTELFPIYKEAMAQGWDILAIYHSHTFTEAYPSTTDVRLALYPDSLYLIVSLQDSHRPVIRAFHIKEGKITEEVLKII